MASRIFDLPEPLRPVIALKASSKPSITVLWPYDLKPSMTIDLICILQTDEDDCRFLFSFFGYSFEMAVMAPFSRSRRDTLTLTRIQRLPHNRVLAYDDYVASSAFNAMNGAQVLQQCYQIPTFGFPMKNVQNTNFYPYNLEASQLFPILSQISILLQFY